MILFYEFPLFNPILIVHLVIGRANLCSECHILSTTWEVGSVVFIVAIRRCKWLAHRHSGCVKFACFGKWLADWHSGCVQRRGRRHSRRESFRWRCTSSWRRHFSGWRGWSSVFVSCLARPPSRVLEYASTRGGVDIGDNDKSWDTRHGEVWVLDSIELWSFGEIEIVRTRFWCFDLRTKGEEIHRLISQFWEHQWSCYCFQWENQNGISDSTVSTLDVGFFGSDSGKGTHSFKPHNNLVFHSSISSFHFPAYPFKKINSANSVQGKWLDMFLIFLRFREHVLE